MHVSRRGPLLTEPGRIYNVVQQGTEAGRLGIIVDAASKPFLAAPFYVRNNGDYGLDGDLDNLPRTLLGVGDTRSAAELHAVRHGAGPQVHARPDLLLAEGLDR